MTYLEAIQIVDRGMERWRSQPHNAKWWKRIDGTPIPNDLSVCIAEEFSGTHISPSLREMDWAMSKNGDGMVDTVRGAVWLARLHQVFFGWACVKVCNSPAFKPGQTVHVFAAPGVTERGTFRIAEISPPGRFFSGWIGTADFLPKGMRKGDMLVVQARCECTQLQATEDHPAGRITKSTCPIHGRPAAERNAG